MDKKIDAKVSILLKFSKIEHTKLTWLCPRGITVGVLLKKWILYLMSKPVTANAITAVIFKTVKK